MHIQILFQCHAQQTLHNSLTNTNTKFELFTQSIKPENSERYFLNSLHSLNQTLPILP